MSIPSIPILLKEARIFPEVYRHYHVPVVKAYFGSRIGVALLKTASKLDGTLPFNVSDKIKRGLASKVQLVSFGNKDDDEAKDIRIISASINKEVGRADTCSITLRLDTPIGSLVPSVLAERNWVYVTLGYADAAPDDTISNYFAGNALAHSFVGTIKQPDFNYSADGAMEISIEAVSAFDGMNRKVTLTTVLEAMPIAGFIETLLAPFKGFLTTSYSPGAAIVLALPPDGKKLVKDFNLKVGTPMDFIRFICATLGLKFFLGIKQDGSPLLMNLSLFTAYDDLIGADSILATLSSFRLPYFLHYKEGLRNCRSLKISRENNSGSGETSGSASGTGLPTTTTFTQPDGAQVEYVLSEEKFDVYVNSKGGYENIDAFNAVVAYTANFEIEKEKILNDFYTEIVKPTETGTPTQAPANAANQGSGGSAWKMDFELIRGEPGLALFQAIDQVPDLEDKNGGTYGIKGVYDPTLKIAGYANRTWIIHSLTHTYSGGALTTSGTVVK